MVKGGKLLLVGIMLDRLSFCFLDDHDFLKSSVFILGTKILRGKDLHIQAIVCI